MPMPSEFRSFTSARGQRILRVFRGVLFSNFDDGSFVFALESRLCSRAQELMDHDPTIGLATALRLSLIEWREKGQSVRSSTHAFVSSPPA